MDAVIVSINPLIPQSWGIFLCWGTPPDPRQEVSCTSFSKGSFRWGFPRWTPQYSYLVPTICRFITGKRICDGITSVLDVAHVSVDIAGYETIYYLRTTCPQSLSTLKLRKLSRHFGLPRNKPIGRCSPVTVGVNLYTGVICTVRFNMRRLIYG